MATQQEVTKKLMYALDKATFSGANAYEQANEALKSLDKAIDYATNGTNKHFKTLAEVIEQLVKDCNSVGSADKFLKNYCGINLDNTDTGAITGSDAGGSIVKTAESIIPETKSLDTSFTGNSFTVNGLTVKLGNGKIFNDLSPKEKSFWQSMKSYWIESVLNHISNSYGSNFSFNSNSSVHELTVTFSSTEGGYLGLTSPKFETGDYYVDYYKKKATALNLDINTYYFNKVTSADPNGSPAPTSEADRVGYLDRNIAHEMTHAIMYANIDFNFLLPRVFLEGIAELTHGADDTRKDDLKALAADSTKLKNALNGSTYVSGVKSPTYSGGYILLRYLAKQASESLPSTVGVNKNNTISNTSIYGTAYDDTLTNSGNYVTISSDSGKDKIVNSGTNVLVYSGNDNDTINNNNSNAKNVSIFGGNGDDSISSYGERSSLVGGDGADTFYSGGKYSTILGGGGNDSIYISSFGSYSTVNAYTGNDIINNVGGAGILFEYRSGDGNDLIKGFNSSSTLRIGNGTTDTYSKSTNGSDIIVTVGTGKITLSGAASLSAVNIKGSLSSGSIFTEGNDNYNNSVSGVTLNALGGNDSINNTGSNVVIYGGSGNDSIRNDYGNNVTINIGAGKDSVIAWGSNIKINDDSGDNYVHLYGNAKSVTVITGNDNDSVKSGAKVASISTGSGNDSVYLYANAENHTINTGDGADTVDSGGKSVSISTGNGNDSVHLYINAENHTINTGDGKDSIYTGGQTVSVNAGSDNDYIYIYKQAVKTTVTGGAGDDTIKNYSKNGVLYIYKPGDGNDSIWGFDSTSTLSISGAAFSKTKSSNNKDWLVKVGNNTITLQGAASLTSPNIVSDYKPSSFTEGNDNYNNTVGGVTLNALGGNDYINNTGSKVTIYGGAGNDKIYNYASGKVTISGGSGADTITNYGAAASLVGGTGNDVIWGDAGKDTIRGGSNNDKLHGEAGNDKIYGDAGNDSLWGGTGNDSLWGGSGKDVFIYKPGEGTDRIFDYASGDMLKILEEDGSKGSFTKSSFSGGDLTLTISGGGKVIFDGVSSGDKFNINGKTYTLSGTKLK